MAKQKKAKIEISVSGEFNVEVPDSNLKLFQTGVDESKLSLDITIPAGNSDLYFSIYSDNFKNGGMKVSKVHANNYHFVVSGQVEFDLDLSIMQDAFDYLNANKDVSVLLTNVSDQDVNSYYIDGDEDKTLNIGTVKLLN